MKPNNKNSNPYTKMPHKILRAQNLSNNAKLILAHLTSFNPSRPSYELLKRLTGLGNTSISNALKELMAAGIIRVRQGSSLTRRTNEYEILDEDKWKIIPISLRKQAPSSYERTGSPESGAKALPNEDTNYINQNRSIDNPNNHTASESKDTQEQLSANANLGEKEIQEITIFENDFRETLTGKTFFPDAKEQVKFFIEAHGPIIKIEWLRNIVFSKFKGFRSRWRNDVISDIENGYEDGLAAWKASQVSTQDSIRFASIKFPTSNDLKSSGEIPNDEQLRQRIQNIRKR